MEKKTLFILLLSLSSIIKAQVGINTEQVGNNILYIDSKTNNLSAGSDNEIDDVVVDTKGNMGIGTSEPKAKLHISSLTKGAFKISNVANLEEGFVATSDGDGNISFKELGPTSSNMIFSDTGINIPTTTDFFFDTGTYIDLNPGNWILMFQIIVLSSSSQATTNLQSSMKFTLADDTTLQGLTPSQDVGKEFSIPFWIGTTAGVTKKSTIGTNININNNTNGIKRYYLIAGKTVLPTGFIIMLQFLYKGKVANRLFLDLRLY